MKVFIINKKKAWLTFLTILIIVIICISYLIIESSKTFAIQSYNNSFKFNEFNDKISNLVNSKEKIAYLTFDDGPTIAVTPKILDILKA